MCPKYHFPEDVTTYHPFMIFFVNSFKTFLCLTCFQQYTGFAGASFETASGRSSVLQLVRGKQLFCKKVPFFFLKIQVCLIVLQ